MDVNQDNKVDLNDAIQIVREKTEELKDKVVLEEPCEEAPKPKRGRPKKEETGK